MFIADGRRTGVGRFLGLRFVLGFSFSFCLLGLTLGLLPCPAFTLLSDLLPAFDLRVYYRVEPGKFLGGDGLVAFGHGGLAAAAVLCEEPGCGES